MSYYPADHKLIYQHSLLDKPEFTRSGPSFFSNLSSVSAYDFDRFLLRSLISVLWVAGLYCLFNAAAIFISWANQELRARANTSKFKSSSSSSSFFTPKSSSKISSQFAYAYNDNNYRSKNQADDLESQFSSSTTSIPGLSYSPEASSPASGCNSPPLSAVSSNFDASVYSLSQRRLDSSFFSKSKNPTIGIVDPYDPTLISGQPVIKIH